MYAKSSSFKLSGLAIVLGIAFLLGSCVTYDYTAFKASRPRSILVMPPVNLSMDVKAPATFLATSVYPLAESGYYVIPPTLSDQMFKQNGVTVAEEAWAIDYKRLYDIFGVDSAMYITITGFGASYIVIDSRVTASAEAKLVDLRTGQELWSGTAYAQSSNNVGSSGGGLLGMVITAAVNQAINTLSEKAHLTGRDANYHLLSAGRRGFILYGPYHPRYQTD